MFAFTFIHSTECDVEELRKFQNQERFEKKIMRYLRNVSRVLIASFAIIMIGGMIAVNGEVASQEMGMTIESTPDDSVYEPEYGIKILSTEPSYDIEIVEPETTTESTTTTTEEVTTTTTTTTTSESTTTTEEMTTTTTESTKPVTTTKVTTTTKKKKTTTTAKTTVDGESQSSTTKTTAVAYDASNLPITQAEFYMLANLVAHEYGADWVSLHEKAKVVMTVMNRVRDSRFPNTIRGVILQRNQFCWVPDSYYWRRTTQSCKDAVVYYFNHQSEYSTRLNSFYGRNGVNHFYAV